MRGIEAAFWGKLAKPPELRTSKAGNAFATMSVAVAIGQGDDGKEILQWVRVACFGTTAEIIAAQARKGDRIYCEGILTLNSWAATSGEKRTGLNLAAFRCEKIPAIGKSRPRQERGEHHATDASR